MAINGAAQARYQFAVYISVSVSVLLSTKRDWFKSTFLVVFFANGWFNIEDVELIILIANVGTDIVFLYNNNLSRNVRDIKLLFLKNRTFIILKVLQK